MRRGKNYQRHPARAPPGKRGKEKVKSVPFSRIRLISMTFGTFLFVIFGMLALLFGIEFSWFWGRTLRPSQILKLEQEALDFMLKEINGHLDSVDFTVQSHRNEGLTEFIKSKIPPIQDRLASLKIQTMQYEKMATQIPGGPTMFIESSTKEIDHLINLLVQVELQALSRLNKNIRSVKLSDIPGIDAMHGLRVDLFSMRKSIEFIAGPSAEQVKVLAEHGIRLMPDLWEIGFNGGYSSRDVEAVMNSNVTLQQVIVAISTSSQILAIFSEAFANSEHLQEQIQFTHFISETALPRFVASILFKFGLGRVDIPDILNEDKDTEAYVYDHALQTEHDNAVMEFGKIQKDLDEMRGKYSAILKSVTPLKFLLINRAKTYIMEMKKSKQVGKMNEPTSSDAFVALKNVMFKDLFHLRDRVRRLSGRNVWEMRNFLEKMEGL